MMSIIASTVPAILCALGGAGWLMHIQGAGTLLFLGVVLQALWLWLKFGN